MLKSKATLRITSSSLSVDQLTECLGVPTKGFSKGDSYSVNKRKRSHTQWNRTSRSKENECIELHIAELLDYLEDKLPQLESILHEVEADIFCMLSTDNGQGGACIGADVLRRMANLNVKLVLDVYTDTDE